MRFLFVWLFSFRVKGEVGMPGQDGKAGIKVKIICASLLA